MMCPPFCLTSRVRINTTSFVQNGDHLHFRGILMHLLAATKADNGQLRSVAPFAGQAGPQKPCIVFRPINHTQACTRTGEMPQSGAALICASRSPRKPHDAMPRQEIHPGQFRRRAVEYLVQVSSDMSAAANSLLAVLHRHRPCAYMPDLKSGVLQTV